jgi:hypothetical protein
VREEKGLREGIEQTRRLTKERGSRNGAREGERERKERENREIERKREKKREREIGTDKHQQTRQTGGKHTHTRAISSRCANSPRLMTVAGAPETRAA